MKKNTIKLIGFIAAFVLACYALVIMDGYHQGKTTVNDSALTNGDNESPLSRIKWEFERLKDPVTNSIPENIRRMELEFAKTLPKKKKESKSTGWVSRGPFNVGGRTRGAALDITDENVIIAGGVSGGIWRSTDAGNSWDKMTHQDQLHNVSCLVQDTRTGKTNVWYHGTGEVSGNSASESFTAHFLGDGIYKSIDGGVNWELIESTVSGTPYWNDSWDFVWDLALDPANDTADVVYAALSKAIRKSMDGGETWTDLIPYSGAGPLYTELSITSTGVLYLGMGLAGFGSSWQGIFRCTDGETLVDITPPGFGSDVNRTVIGINPSNENEVYFLTNREGTTGQLSEVFFGGLERNTLWKYTYVDGDGTGSGGIWEDLSTNLPVGDINHFNNFYVQGSYDMAIAVKPDEPNTVFLGGTNIWRSTDGFSTPNNTIQIGGYKRDSNDEDWDIWDTHHPDQHAFMFLPSNPDVLISANDGGVFRTNNCMDNNVTWDRLNNGYVTTQFYTVIIDEQTNSDVIVGGLQDNGNFFVNSDDPEDIWVMPLNGDGSFGYIADSGQTYYLSIQRGKVYKMLLDDLGTPTGYTRMDPIGYEPYSFIQAFAVDPNDNNIMYFPGFQQLWRNNNLSSIVLNNQTDSISTGWTEFSWSPPNGVTAIAVSESNPPHRLYYASGGKVYRIDSANVSDPVEHTKLTYTTSNIGNISCIAIDPNDADKIMVILSSYRIYSIYYSEDGGATFHKVAGNLEEMESGLGNGPSIRWAEIMPLDGGNLYMVATSVGVFGTNNLRLDVDSTEWIDIGEGVIGNVVSEMIVSRQTDGFVALATHGNGIYTRHIDWFNTIYGVDEKHSVSAFDTKIYPNPASDFVNAEFYQSQTGQTNITVYDCSGRIIKEVGNTTYTEGVQNILINTSQYQSGLYYVSIVSGNQQEVKRFIVQ